MTTDDAPRRGMQAADVRTLALVAGVASGCCVSAGWSAPAVGMATAAVVGLFAAIVRRVTSDDD